jgi:hypothetical protein
MLKSKIPMPAVLCMVRSRTVPLVLNSSSFIRQSLKEAGIPVFKAAADIVERTGRFIHLSIVSRCTH